ncbi:MAG: TIR domain-containing protein [Flavobacterium sp.]|nr:MAG: TIR domain-containing protein [Flavobacterium sp.]
MSLLTSSYLKGVYNNNVVSLNENLRTRSYSADVSSKFDIFLSHSYLDRDEVLGLYKELTNRGFSVYVDWIVDPQLDRNNVTKESAELIRARLKASRTLLLAISHNASVSKWMPWELGYADGNTGFCAIAPISKDNLTRNSFSGVEYLSLYPYVNHQNDTSGKSQLWIEQSDGQYVILSSWVRNFLRPFKHQ